MIFALFLPTLVMASENCSTTSEAASVEEQLEIKTDVPNHLKGAQICVFKTSSGYNCVPAEKFKIVPRKQQFIVTKTKQLDKTMCSAEINKNRVSLLAGNGPKEGLDKTVSATQVKIESRTGAVGGIQYQRLVTERISLGVQAQTNESALVNIGLDF